VTAENPIISLKGVQKYYGEYHAAWPLWLWEDDAFTGDRGV
jgi:hypothetical protein